ncbi:hypothetical protein LshimejAT787_1100960 [Lyophyllum shimeji]|uniref:Uncharacterized protein n=1 Tax=Lyophyllum shimeji TaxID=47721 RepID=A0A9P3PUU8_LYOSH|nr:hypothetical protein LshimejAT787_1100960 [Lyophyllum shimeji]
MVCTASPSPLVQGHTAQRNAMPCKNACQQYHTVLRRETSRRQQNKQMKRNIKPMRRKGGEGWMRRASEWTELRRSSGNEPIFVSFFFCLRGGVTGRPTFIPPTPDSQRHGGQDTAYLE